MIERSSITAITLMAAAAIGWLQTPPSAAQDTAAAPGEMTTSGGGGNGPGGLSAHDVMGKRLLDADGNPIGMIDGVSRDGVTAEVRGGAGGKPIMVPMAELSLGTGAHTVIEQRDSRAAALNAMNAAAPQHTIGVEQKTVTHSATTTYTPGTVTRTTSTYSQHTGP